MQTSGSDTPTTAPSKPRRTTLWLVGIGLLVLLGASLSLAPLGCLPGFNRTPQRPLAEADAAPLIIPDVVPKPVEQVDLERYMGLWYEIARYPNSFQDQLVGVTAEYILNDDGETFQVINRGRMQNLDGPERRSEAVGGIIDSETFARLYVQFIWPFRADYWIIDLADDYSYAVVGQPSKQYLWLLSRTPTLERDVLQGILDRLPANGYDPRKLDLTPQSADPLAEGLPPNPGS